MRIACADIGTNSARLVIADVDESFGLNTLAHIHRTIRLGEGVDARGAISDAAMDRLVEALSEFSALADSYGASRTVIAGTSASRDARNDLVNSVYARTGLHYEVLSGIDEADWSFRGALSALPHLEDRAITCDIGGGSTEFTLGRLCGQIYKRCSLNVGSVRILERFLKSQPASVFDIERAREFVRRELAACRWLKTSNAPLVGASDTHRILLQLSGQPSQVLTRRDVDTWSDRLLGMTREEVRLLNPDQLTGRDDIFPLAALICRESMVHIGCDALMVSERGLVHGLALREFGRLKQSGVSMTDLQP